MSSVTTAATYSEKRNSAGVLLPLLFGATVLVSACLLFFVQPLSSKLILPWFGGSAAVWITCLLFFQTALLLGYAYAHALTRTVRPRYQALVHIALLISSLLVLPIFPGARWIPHPGADPTWPVLGALASSVGLPYFLLSATSPLVQSWYARLSAEGLPYRYFALSNAGSLLALLAFPMLLEPSFSAHQQVWFWSTGFVIFAALCGVSSLFTMKHGSSQTGSIKKEFSARGRGDAGVVLICIALAACASALLLTTTSLLTETIAPMPLLWVLPLSVYLLTFILCFENNRWYRRLMFLPLVLPALAFLVSSTGPLTNHSIRMEIPIVCGALFVCCMACHGELAKLKPEPAGLTFFYLALSLGGALGGIFIGLLAPRIFPAHYEYPLTFLCCPALLLYVLRRKGVVGVRDLRLWRLGAGATIVLAGYACAETWHQAGPARLLARNFYGALLVQDEVNHKQIVRVLNHGHITHGVQFLRPELRHLATTYYARDSGAGLAWRTLAKNGPMRVGIVGLGAGTLAAYGRSGDVLRFYEINPLVVRIANTQFTYLSDCPAHVDIVLGDARLSLASEPDQKFDLLVIDAFSGDAIPVHLLTREAFRLYWRHLKPDGVLAIHVSNRYVRLAPVLKLAAEEANKEAWKIESEDHEIQEIYPSTYVLITGRRGFFHSPLLRADIEKIEVPTRLRPWTDDYSSLWQLLNFKGE